jgi:hypothetical protein
VKEGDTMKKMEGHSFLRSVLRSHYGSEEPEPIHRAVVESAYFIDPSVVAQTGRLPLLRARRMASDERRNTVVNAEFVSDNFPPHYVFLAATSHLRDNGSTHLCHIYGGNGEARDTFFYTNLANLCLLPSFLAKHADTDDAIVNLLKECAFLLYGFDPTGEVGARQRTPGLRERIQITSPPNRPLYEVLQAKRDAKFIAARTAGFLFTPGGTIDRGAPWVSEMMTRRDHSNAPSPSQME